MVCHPTVQEMHSPGAKAPSQDVGADYEVLVCVESSPWANKGLPPPSAGVVLGGGGGGGGGGGRGGGKGQGWAERGAVKQIRLHYNHKLEM